MESVFGKGWDSKTPQELLFEMSQWLDEDGETDTVSISVSRDTLFALSIYINETCDWKGTVFYAL